MSREEPGFPKLYAIVDRTTLDARNVLVGAFARELRDAGVRLVQYRDKAGSPQEVLAAAAEISAVFAGTGTVLVMNDRADLAVLAGWRGVHVGHRDMPVGAVRRVFRGGDASVRPHSSREKMRDERGTHDFGASSDCLVGVSTHNEEQVRVADAAVDPGSENPDLHPGLSAADYIAIGPVFATASKVDAEPVVGLEGVRRARALTEKPLIAIGGITRANARAVIEAGADSVAVIGGLFAEGESVAEVARDFLRILL